MMRKPKTILVALLLPTVVALSAARYQEPGPQQVVEKYCESASAGDLEQVAKYTTKYPREFWELEMKEIREQARKEFGAEADVQVRPGMDGISRPYVPGENDSYRWFINKYFPKGMSDHPESKQVLKEITGVWVKGSEARVRAVIGYADLKDHRFTWEFYLYKVEGEGWKIFRIDTPKLKEKYAIPDDAAAANN